MKLESNTAFVPKLTLFTKVLGPTTEVDENEPTQSIQEGYAPNRAGEPHRYQVLTVAALSGNALAAFWWDLGPSDDFTVTVDYSTYPMPPYHQWAEWEHTVAELRFYAARDRGDDWAIQMLHEQTQTSSIITDYWDLLAEDRQLVRNRSTFGPGGVIQRNGFSNLAARGQREKLAEAGIVGKHGYFYD